MSEFQASGDDYVIQGKFADRKNNVGAELSLEFKGENEIRIKQICGTEEIRQNFPRIEKEHKCSC